MPNAPFIILTLIFATFLVSIFLDFEVKDRKNLFKMGVFVSFVFIFDVFIWINFGYVTFKNFYPLLAQIPLYLAFLFISKYKGIKLAFVHFTVIAIVSSILVAAFVISYYLGYSESVASAIGLFLYIPTGFIAYRYFRPYLLYMLRNTDKGWYGFSIIPLSYSILIYSSSKYHVNSELLELSLTQNIRSLIFILISYSMILWLFKQNREYLTLANEQNLLQLQIGASHHYLESLKESQANTLIYRHDMRHHLNLINAYLSDDNKEVAQNYIDEVKKCIDDISVEDFCDNYSLNLVLHYYVNKARNEQIHVETHLELPKETTVSDIDLCLVFSNTLENAINALTLVDSTKVKFLKILCKTKNNRFIVEIENNYVGDIHFDNELPISTIKNHGYGTKSIASIVTKYNGQYATTAENNIYKTQIIM